MLKNKMTQEIQTEKKSDEKPSCNCRFWLNMFLVFIFTAGVVGGGVYYFMQKTMENEKIHVTESIENEMQQKIGDSKEKEDSHKEIEQLQEQLRDKEKLVENEKEKAYFSQIMLSYIKDRNIFASDEYGISLTTPENWKISPNPLKEKDDDILSFSIIPSEQENCGQLNNTETCLDKINFGITQNKDGLTFKEYLNNARNYSDQFIKDYKEFDFKNKKAYKFIHVSSYDGSENINYWIQLDNNILFYIRESYLKENQKKYFEQIFSSIVF